MTVVPVPTRAVVNYWPKDNKNFGPKFVRKAMPWFEQFWHENSRYPAPEEIMARFGCTLQQVNLLNRHKFWLQSLSVRGIALPTLSDTGIQELTDKQIAAITMLTNFNDLEPMDQKMAAIGVTTEELNGWYQNPYFKRALQNRADTVLDNVSSTATVELARGIQKGDFRFIKFYYEITGQAQSPEAVNVKQAMQILVEAVQKHVKDPELLKKIGDEVNAMRAVRGL